jgi:hypothetical protein
VGVADVTVSARLRLELQVRAGRILLCRRVTASRQQVQRHAAGESNYALQAFMLRETSDGLVFTRGRPDDPETLEPLAPRALHVHAVWYPPAPAPLPRAFQCLSEAERHRVVIQL